jgi:hypothetical protein
MPFDLSWHGVEHDINLFHEPDLYDPNTIGSLFKGWLRDLPDEILPKSKQDDLADKYGSSPTAPDALKAVLRMLPPWNYYLLFAITCHLSLLHAYVETNRMDYNNLYICFAPALKVNAVCFRWLVTDWRNCWDGCATEKEALEAEYRILDGESDIGREEFVEQAPGAEEVDARAESALDQESGANDPKAGKAPQRPAALKLGKSDESHEEEPAKKTPSHSRVASQLPELSPQKPISPIQIPGQK